MLPLAYHADNDIVRWWVVFAVAGAIAAVALAAAAALLVRERPPDGPRVAPIVALVFAALTALGVLTGFYFLVPLVSLPALVVGVLAVSPASRSPRSLALIAFVASLLAFDVGASAVAACVVTDACFH